MLDTKSIRNGTGRWGQMGLWAVVLGLGCAAAAQGYTYYEPHSHGAAVSLAVQSSGVMTVTQGSTSFTVRSFFSRPSGGMLFLGTADTGTNNQTWNVAVTGGGTQYTATGSNSWYSLTRTITVYPNRIEVKDAFTNLTNAVRGVRFAHEIVAADAASALVAGVPLAQVGSGLNVPERPFVQVVKSGVSLGMVARDDVFRNQSVCYYTASGGKYGIKDDNLGLPAYGTYTTRWELYPIDSADAFDFYNAVRAEWGTANATIPGLFTFIYPQRAWQKYSKRLDVMSVSEMKEWLDTTGVTTICFVVTDDVENGNIEAFGSRYLVSPGSKAYWRPIVDRLRQAKPDIKICPYFHMGADIPNDSAVLSSQMILNGGTAKSFTNYMGIVRWYYYPTQTNTFGARIQQVFNQVFSDFNTNTFYWDEYSYGYKSEYLQGADWDNCSVQIDNSTNGVTKQLTLTALVTKPLREQLTQTLLDRGLTLWTNWEPTTELDTAQNQPHFMEGFYTGQYAARGYLASPIQLYGDSPSVEPHSNADIMDNISTFLQKGLLYAHIANGAYAETTPSILKYVYPITPAELHPGYILGKERILTNVSGAFGFGDNRTMTAYVYDDSGRLKSDTGQPVSQNGKTYRLVTLNAGELAVIGPEMPRPVMPVFADDFEGPAPGSVPDAYKWSIVFGGNGTSATMATDVPAVQGSQSARIAGVNKTTNIGIKSIIRTGPFTTFFVSAAVRIDSDAEANSGAGLDLMSGSDISAGLRLIPKGAGTGQYDVKVISNLTNPGTGTKWDTVATGLPIATWERWVFGVRITDNVTGDGVYSVYRNGIKLADNVTFHAFSAGVIAIAQVQCFCDLNYWHLDDVQVFDVPIVPVPPTTLSGQVTLEKYVGDMTLTPAEIQFRQNGQLVQILLATLDADGNFSVNSGLAPGTYDVAFKAACWLRKVVPGVVFPTLTAPDPINVTLPCGDLDGNNAVDSTDLSVTLKRMDGIGN